MAQLIRIEAFMDRFQDPVLRVGRRRPERGAGEQPVTDQPGALGAQGLIQIAADRRRELQVEVKGLDAEPP